MAVMTLKGLVGASDEVSTRFVAEVFPNLANLVSPAVYVTAVAYWATLGYSVYSGRQGIDPWDFGKRAMLTILVFTCLNWGTGGSMIYTAWAAATESLAANVMSGGSTTTMLDALYVNIGKVSSTLMNVSWRQFGMILMGYGLFLVNCILFVCALLNMLIAKFGAAICMAIMPVMVGFFFFQGTRQWAMNWLSKMLNFTLVYVMSIAIVRFGYAAFGDAIDEVTKAATISDAALITAQQYGTLLIVVGILVICMLQVRGWAAALSSGATVQGGSLVMMAIRSAGIR
ncbi:type IV secretion system protein [Pseudomonas sp. Bout1]|uniref:type IV secretion system protein n=1 Tax=Pseudomonas sp. Bout1 TaxID=3048600 RepID=UPI002AB3CEAF|nr:type IV secretion system protein [Pseudomonas sp. Bout1]MDY7536432.1 type IV secretion system protein [Pseudomonas sp. Bout1]MEB0187505.1 type IV secretion system protein [Pseudomonas sp. Bout1]